jgi:hypothetical protein
MIQNGPNQPMWDDGGPAPRLLRIGEPFNPWHRVCGFYPPDVVARQRDLTDGQKRLYERGVRWAGKNGTFWRSFPAIAEELGKSVRQVKDDMATLEEKRLIEHTRRRRQSNVYHFLWHRIFEVQSAAHPKCSLKVQDSTLEVQDSVKNRPLKVQPTARESCPSLNFVKKESSSEASAPVQELATAETTDDDSPISQNTENPNPQDRDRLVETAREQLQMARAAGMSFAGVISQQTLAQVRRPDREITVQILEAFSDCDDYQVWLPTTVSRGLARKAKSATWGLYLADAKNQAEDLRLKREAEEKRERDWQIELERRRAAEAEAVAELDIPEPLLQAYGRIQGRLEGRRVPRPLKARLERRGELISPNELERQISGWKRCPDCRDEGTLGSAIARDLRFCGCPAGIEASYPDGADWPEREIARVHADAKSLLVAACRAVGLAFTADAIEDSEVTDNGETLQVQLSDRQFGIPEADVRRPVERLGWQRRILITGGWHAKRQPEPAPTARPEAAAPAAPHPEHQAEPVAINRGIEAIGLPDTPRSIVESVTCSHCGGFALVRYTNGPIERCGCRQKAGGDLNRIPASSAPGIRLSASARCRSY